MRLPFIIVIFLFLIPSIGLGQSRTDTARVDPDYTYQKKNSFTSVFYGQPGDAAAWSLLLPGAGQLYNKRWWKVPLVWAGEGFLIINLYNKNQVLKSWDQCWRNIIADNTNTTCDIVSVNSNLISTTTMSQTTNQTEAFNERQGAKSARELAWVFFIAGHLIQTLEAFVDRHLINFNTSPDLGGLQFKSADEMISQRHSIQPVPIFQIAVNLNGW